MGEIDEFADKAGGPLKLITYQPKLTNVYRTRKERLFPTLEIIPNKPPAIG